MVLGVWKNSNKKQFHVVSLERMNCSVVVFFKYSFHTLLHCAVLATLWLFKTLFKKNPRSHHSSWLYGLMIYKWIVSKKSWNELATLDWGWRWNHEKEKELIYDLEDTDVHTGEKCGSHIQKINPLLRHGCDYWHTHTSMHMTDPYNESNCGL